MKIFIISILVITLIDQSIGGRCSNPSAYKGRVVADPWGTYRGECVSFYKTCSGDHRPTTQWRRGTRVKNANIPVGTGIASFTNGNRYVGSNCNRPNPCGHVAIYVGQNSQGIQVWDQWRGQPVHYRTLYFGRGSSSNNGDHFYVIN